MAKGRGMLCKNVRNLDYEEMRMVRGGIGGERMGL
jgi:hypothetical protein